MFVTQKSYQAPFSVDLGGGMRTYWRAAELAVTQVWFIVTIGHTGVRKRARGSGLNIESTTTLLIAEPNEVVKLFDSPPDTMTILAVRAVIPKFNSIGEDWEMSEVSAIWQYQVDSDDGADEVPIEVIETENGQMLPCYPVEGPIPMERLTLLVKLSKKNST
ncbi:MAG: hypothetical protein U1E04_16835 [Hylemonella sp.]|nr:hypothetical protein [Hylemonella sp.]